MTRKSQLRSPAQQSWLKEQAKLERYYRQNYGHIMKCPGCEGEPDSMERLYATDTYRCTRCGYAISGIGRVTALESWELPT
jgi:DNA-directed RNA polymerase subunit RPC12/RpoP